MDLLNRRTLLAAGLLALMTVGTANAGDVKIVAAEFHKGTGDLWSVNVTLKHNDTGWDHYADNWRIVDGEGKILGDRVLYHPHVMEQPFTRSLSNVKIPQGTTMVYIEAHDKVHGWTQKRLAVDLGKATEGRLRVEAVQP